MSNLGWYQIMTTLSKRVGGPINLAGIVFGGGALFGGGAVAGGLLIKNKVSQKLKQKELRSDFELADFCHGGDLTED